MKQIVLPATTSSIKPQYYAVFVGFLRALFRSAGVAVQLEHMPEKTYNYLYARIDDRQVLFDYSDAGDHYDKDCLVFRFHYQMGAPCNVFSFVPVSFYDWDTFYHMVTQVGSSVQNRVCYVQRAYGDAAVRRAVVSSLLRESSLSVYTKLTEQEQYWLEAARSKISVHVPGRNNNMLDRAQWQLMALGVPTISPKLPEILPFGESLIPNVHYLECRSDYSDLISILERVMLGAFDKELATIRKESKLLFQLTATPKAVITWMEQVLR